MSLDNHKITTYQDNVSSLPDYPSDAGYTAKQLKAIFDGRTDKEIKEKFNALIDELNDVIAKLEARDSSAENNAKEHADEIISEHDAADEAHSDIRSLISELARRLNAVADSDDVTLDQLSELVAYIKDNRELIESITTLKANAADVYNRSTIDAMLRELKLLGGSGNGAVVISVHDELYNTIVPEDGQVYVVKYENMPYGEDPSLISPEVFYRLRIGDGVTPLCDIPNVSNIQSGTGNGSAILVDPTYDNGDDGLEAPNNIAEGQYSVSFGKYLKNYGKAAAAFGYSNEITKNGARSFVAGMDNIADATRVLIAAHDSRAEGIGAGIFGGTRNTVEADTGTILGGVNNKLLANAVYAILAGQHLISDVPNQIVLGRYNKEDNDALIVFGCGKSVNNRSNSLVLKQDGTMEFNNTVKFEGKTLDEILSAPVFKSGTSAPTTLNDGEVFFVYEE